MSNLNDRIALELGRAHFARIIAEARADQAEAKLEEAVAAAPAPRKRAARKPKAPPADATN